MRKTLVVCLFILVTILTIDIAYSTDGRNVVFISQYSSRSMDINTLEYYKKIRDNFSVYIIQDSAVAENKPEWRSSYRDSDLIFVISLSDSVLNNSTNAFCGNLSVVLKKQRV